MFSKLLSTNNDSQEDDKNGWIITNKSKYNDNGYKELINLKSKGNLGAIIEFLLIIIPDRNEQ